MKKNVLVLGANGMAGHMVKLYLEELESYDVFGLARSCSGEKCIPLDVTQEAQLKDVIKEHAFNVVINCIGILNKDAEENPQKSIWINSYLPHLLSSFAKELNFKLIHISTDCVFSGKQGGYSENSFKDGLDTYAKSKALGEVENDTDLTFRTSIIGPELKSNGIGLFHWFMNQNQPISGYKRAFWTGVTTLELAKAMDRAIQSDLTGLYHLVYTEKINKYDLLKIFNNLFRENAIEIDANDSYSVDKSLVNTREDFDFKVASYEEMLSDMRQWMSDHKSIYAHYNFS